MADVKHSFAAAGVLVVSAMAAVVGQQSYRPVTAERLKNPDAADWLMVRRTYDGWGYSPLKQITPANVARLQPVWTFATGQENGHEAPPIVNGGVMFVATPGNQVIALDAKSGQLIWRYQRQAARRRGAAASDQPRCRAARRQSVVRRRRSRARRARREDRQARSGRRRWRTTARAITCRSRRWWSAAR